MHITTREYTYSVCVLAEIYSSLLLIQWTVASVITLTGKTHPRLFIKQKLNEYTKIINHSFDQSNFNCFKQNNTYTQYIGGNLTSRCFIFYIGVHFMFLLILLILKLPSFINFLLTVVKVVNFSFYILHYRAIIRPSIFS